MYINSTAKIYEIIIFNHLLFTFNSSAAHSHLVRLKFFCFYFTEKTCFVMRDLETATLGKVGEIVNALVLHTEEVGTTYFMCPMDIEMVGHVSDILPGQVNLI